MNRLSGTTVIVTGGAVSMGVARWTQEGAREAIFDMSEDEGQAVAADLTAAGHRVVLWKVDVPDEAAMKAAAGSVHPIGHIGEPDGIAGVVVRLAPDEARVVTGAEIASDGGDTAH